MKKVQRVFLIAASAVFLATQAQAIMYFARPYDPNLQRWLTRDPIGERGGLNLYGFVFNAPTISIDALGLDAGGRVGPGFPFDGYHTFPLGGDEPLPPMPPIDNDSIRTDDAVFALAIPAARAFCSNPALDLGASAESGADESSLEGSEATRAALGKGPNASPGSPLTPAMKSGLQDNLNAAQKTLENAKNGVNNAGNSISPQQAARVIKTMQNRVDTISKTLNSGCQGAKN
jgi:uncharacterized protein RhaS with RHS repeats